MGLFYSLDKPPLGFYKNIFEAPVPKVWGITCQFFHAPGEAKSNYLPPIFLLTPGYIKSGFTLVVFFLN